MIALSTPVLFVLVCVGLLGLAISRRLSSGHWLATALFSIYLVGVAHFALLPLRFNPDLASEVGPLDFGTLIELRPFFLSGTYGMPIEQVFLNILLTVPFGFGLPFVRQELRGREVVAVGLAFCVGIELAQLLADVTYLALPTWSVDVNDVLLNGVGVVVGYAAYVAFRSAYRLTAGRLPVRRSVWTHFHDALMP